VTNRLTVACVRPFVLNHRDRRFPPLFDRGCRAVGAGRKRLAVDDELETGSSLPAGCSPPRTHAAIAARNPRHRRRRDECTHDVQSWNQWAAFIRDNVIDITFLL